MDGAREVFETPRLRGREMSLDDLDFVASLLGDADVMRFYPKRYTRAEARGWIERQLERYAEHGHGLWLVVDRFTAAPVGQVGLLRQEVDGSAELEVGYLVHQPFWRRGYATEAATAARDHAFAKCGARRVISLIRPENIPSQGVARKLGMVAEGRTMFRGLEHVVFATTTGSTH